MEINYVIHNICRNGSVKFQRLYKVSVADKIILSWTDHDNSIRLSQNLVVDTDIDNFFNLPNYLEGCYSKNINPLPQLRKMFPNAKITFESNAVFFEDMCILTYAHADLMASVEKVKEFIKFLNENNYQLA